MKDGPSRFDSALVTLDLAMREKGHLWIYSSDGRETEIVVVNERPSADVPKVWQGYGVRQASMREFSHGRGR